MTRSTASVPQTRAFSTLFLIEMWERFGFYGMQVLMVTYMMKKLGFVDTRANLVWGAAAALIYATPAIGGWIGDKLLGTRRTMKIGAVVLALGYALLWLPTDNPYFCTGARRDHRRQRLVQAELPAIWCARSTRATTPRSTARSPCTTWR